VAGLGRLRSFGHQGLLDTLAGTGLRGALTARGRLRFVAEGPAARHLGRAEQSGHAEGMDDSAAPRWPRWRPTLQQRVQLVVTALLVLLVVSGLVALATSQRADRANEYVAQELLPALVGVERLQKAYLDQQTGVRGFALTEQPSFLEPYEAAPAVIEEEHRGLRATLDGDEAALAALAAVQRAYEEWHSQAVVPVLSHLRAGRAAVAMQVIESGTGNRLFGALRERVDTLRAAVQDMIAAATTRLDEARTTALWIVGLAFGVAVLLAAVTMMELRRTVTRPIAGLVGSVSAVAGGELDRSVRQQGPPEIEEIASAVEQMRRKLADHTREAVVAERRQTKLREAERIATDLQDHVIERLFDTGISLSSLASRQPALAEPLLVAVQELDGAIRELRGVVFDLAATEPGQAGLRDRVVSLAGEVERVVGVAPDLDFYGPVDHVLSAEQADELVETVRDVLSGIAMQRTAERVSVRLAVEGSMLHLRVVHDGSAPADNWSAVAGSAERLGGSCTVRRTEDGDTALDWTVPAG